MSDPTLEEHERRVARAQAKLATDVARLTTVGRSLGKGAGRVTKVALLCGGGILLLSFALTRKPRRTRALANRSALERRTLTRRLFEAVIVEAARLAAAHFGTKMLMASASDRRLPSSTAQVPD